MRSFLTAVILFAITAAAVAAPTANDVDTADIPSHVYVDTGPTWMLYVLPGLLAAVLVLIIAGSAHGIFVQRRASVSVDKIRSDAAGNVDVYHQHLKRSIELSERNLAAFEQQVELLRQIVAELRKK
jgi:hypothetical protein